MTSILTRARFAIVALLMLFVVVAALPALAQQPTSVNPTADSVKEDTLLQQLKTIDGRCSIPDQKACTIEQPAGQAWRDFHQRTLPWLGAVAILGVLLLLVVFYLSRGMVKIENGRSGRTVVRFSEFERFVHWMTAACFILLGLSGLNITFGKQLLLPIIGEGAFAGWSQLAKYVHNYLSFPFTIGVVLILLIWIGGNIPNKIDVEWIKRGGGIVGDDHPPAEKFNAGQKMIYWIVIVGGTAVAITGYLLMFPFYATGIEGMQTAQMIHGIVALLFVAAMLAHIYIGTIGMEGAFEAMGTGTVDVNWAEQHHALWLADIEERSGKDVPRSRAAAEPAE
jgi:formate dehydrogenase subunit gamma